jgi:fructuronate reductase
MTGEAAHSFTPAPGQDLEAYSAILLTRFANAALGHRLIQIAMDGSQKIPQRWLETLAAQARQQRVCPSILKALGAWVAHVRGDSHEVSDPRAAELSALWREHGRDGVLDALFSESGIYRDSWVMSSVDRRLLMSAVENPASL